MPDKTVKLPDAQHSITIRPTPGRVVVRANGQTIVDTTAALTLDESRHDLVQYVPLADVDAAVLRPSDTQTYCPYKGDASYHSVATAEGVVEDALWFYPEPFPAVGEIAEHVAFYTDRVEVIVEDR
jgi:uncharacterized protein (DUF427 family)